ncbi:hypothetical protein CVT26_014585 [Gymnopilus dilepis]|uniref:Uncharacterized protein n=1 Tax=Gymnopilus dilepis TaxID=231916 RepID=A0A409VVP1_9AGAR|nr:hypothetical protein CVT26_014585 [Gymnopilus dilepis]
MRPTNWFSFLKPSVGHLASAQPEFTLRAVLLGLAIGCLICFTNLSLGLQSGWISMMSIQSALIGFLISKMLPHPLSPQEIIVVQTTAVATGTMPLAAGFVGILPALTLLDEQRDGSPPIRLNWINAVGWSCSVAFFGWDSISELHEGHAYRSKGYSCHLPYANKWYDSQMSSSKSSGTYFSQIIEEQLPFPSGTATAHLISVLHKLPPPDTTVRRRTGYRQVEDEEEDALNPESVLDAPQSLPDEHDDTAERETVEHEGWQDLLWSFSASGLLTLFAYFFPVLFAIPVFGNHLAKEWLWFFTPSLSYVGQGIIMGFPTTLSMNLGMFVGWAILSPLSKELGWAPGPVGDMSNGARGWILWISLGIMCADSLVSLLPVAYEYLEDAIRPWQRGYTGARETSDQDKHHETETEDRLVPNKWVLVGLLSSVVIGTVLVWLVFGHEGIKPWATLLGFILGGMLSIIGVRALGETDLNPVSGLGKISQLFFAWIQPGNIVANIIAGGVAEAGAQQAGDLMQDLKTGHLCHASPRAQFFGQIIGSSVSILITTTAYMFYNRAYVIPGPSFPAPTAYVWLSLARLLRDGQLPENSARFMIIFSALFALLSATKTYASRRNLRWAKWIPSGVAFAIGFLNTPSFSIARLIGGIMEYTYRTRFAKDGGDIRLIVIASGFVLGEGVVSIVSLVLKILGQLTMSKVELAKIKSLTFYKDAYTTARRTSALPQLVCVGKPCKLFQPEVVRCESLGGSGTDIDWKCEADLPDSLRFGKVEVSCEGWSRPGDPYVLKGSCSLEYRLVQVPDALRNGKTDSPLFSPRSYDWPSIIFTFLWLAVLAIILYSFFMSCFRNNNNTTPRAPRPPGYNSRPSTSSSGGGGWFPGGHHDDSPPPPYSKSPPSQGQSGWSSWRPGFWTGAALGGLANHLWNNNNRQRNDPPRTRFYDWERLRPRPAPPPQAQSSWSSWGASRRSSSWQSEDRGEGSSNLGSMRRSTGLGGTNVR